MKTVMLSGVLLKRWLKQNRRMKNERGRQLNSLHAMEDKIAQSIDLADGVVVMFDTEDSSYRSENLIFLNSDGSQRWKAELPMNRGPDRFVGIVLDGEHIRANTWSCFTLWLDPHTGKTLRTVFTK
jgi:hypothetical protein